MYFCLGIKCWVSGYPGVGQGKYSCKMLWLSANSGHLRQSGGLNLWTNITLRWRICGRCKYILSHFSSSKDKGCRPLCDKVDWEEWISWSTFPLYFKSICDLILISDVRPPSQSPGGAKSISSLFSEIYNLQMAVNTPGKHTDTNTTNTNWVPGCSGVVSWPSSILGDVSSPEIYLSRTIYHVFGNFD